MDYAELLAKYQALLIENNDLKKQNKILNNQLGIVEEQTVINIESPQNSMPIISKQNREAKEKVQLFMSL